MVGGTWDLTELFSMVESECRVCNWTGTNKSHYCPVCGDPLYVKGDGKIDWGDKETVTIYRP